MQARTIYKSYDADGNETFNDATISYDAQNRQSYIKDTSGVGYSTWYDAAGNSLGVTGNGEDYRYSYDAANQLSTAGLTGTNCSQDTTSQTGCVKFSYDNNGAETRRWLPNATVIQTSYDNSGRITQVKAVNGATARFDVSWSYTKPGSASPEDGDRSNVQTRTDTVGVNGAVNHGSVTTYGYDSRSRLTSAAEVTPGGRTNASWAYAYDKAGNRTSQTRTGNTQSPTGTLTYGYNAASQLTSIGGDSAGLAYDADGNETSNPGEDWVNVAKRSSTVSPSGDATTIAASMGGTDSTFEYGYGGTNPGSYLLTWMRGNAITHSLTGPASIGDEGGGTLKVLRAPNGKPLAITRGANEVGYYVPDRLGSVMGILSGSGLVTVAYAYDPYGNIRSAPGADAPVAWYNPITYAGGIKDLQTGLYRVGVRWYDPNIGRFTTPDPTSQEVNPYLYAGGNPCNATDFTGGASVRGFGCNAAMVLLGADLSVGWWAATATGAVSGSLRGAAWGAAAGAAVGLAGYFICDGL